MFLPQQPPNLARRPWNLQPLPQGHVVHAPWNPPPPPQGFVVPALAPWNLQPAPQIIVVQAPRQQAPRQQAPRQQAPRQQALRQQAPQQQAPQQQWNPDNCPYGSDCDGVSCGKKNHSWENKQLWTGHCDRGLYCGHHKLRNGACQKLHP